MKPSRKVSARKIFRRVAVSGDQRVVRDGDRDAAGQQDRGIHRRQAEGRNGFEGAVGARAQGRRTVGRPDAGVVIPQQELGEDLHAVARQPGHREVARIEQRAEEGREEHDLGENEPHHSHAERAVHRHVVHALLVLADDGVEPEDEQQRQHEEARQQGTRPAASR